MKFNIFFISVLSVALATSCSAHHNHDDHEGHDHATHNHDEHDHDAHSHEDEDEDADHDEHSAPLAPGDIHFPDSEAEAIGLEVDTLHHDSSFAPVIRCGGVIEAQTAGNLTIVAPQSGVVNIVDRYLAQGAFLNKGQCVALISGRAIQDGDAAAKAKAEYDAALSDYERLGKLVEDKIVSEREYEAARLRYANARAAYEALGSSADGGAKVVSPASGHVVRVMAEHGQYVSAGQAIAVVERCGSKRLRADVPERHYAKLRNVVSANIRTSVSDSTFRLADMGGRLVSVGVSVGDGSSYVPVTFDFTDEGERLLSGSSTSVYLILRGEMGRMSLTVPNEAIIESQGVFFVYTRDAGESDLYHRREVTLGQTDGLRTEVVKGLAEGDIVVGRGARRLHLAGASSAIPAHSHNH